MSIAVVLIGCSADDGDSSELAARLERVDQFVAAHCAATEPCNCVVTVARAGCDATLADDWTARVREGTRRGLTYDAECFDRMEAGIEAIACGWPSPDARHPCHDFCQVFHGKRGEGESCSGFDDFVSDCEAGLLCDRGHCASPCSKLSGLAEGEACRDAVMFTELDRCADGMLCLGDVGRCTRAPGAGEPCPEGYCNDASYCDYQADTPVCRARAGEGGSCEAVGCQPGLTCVWVGGDNGSAQCRAVGQAGDACGDAGCDVGLGCGPSGVCTELGQVGARCDYVGCVEGVLCDYDTATCVAPPVAGQPCIAGECGAGAWCEVTDVAVCSPTKPSAAACAGHRECDSGYCPAGFCENRPGIGDPCVGALVCELGASCDGAVCRASVTHGPAVCVYEGW